MAAKELSPEQKAEADRLKARFKAWQRQLKADGESASQLDLAEQFGFGQSALSQYLNGTIPLNLRAVLKFAEKLGCAPEEISPIVVEETHKQVAIASKVLEGGAGRVEISAEPARPEPRASTDVPLTPNEANNALREAVQRFVTDLTDAHQAGRISLDLMDALQATLKIGTKQTTPHSKRTKKSVGVSNRGRGTGRTATGS
jgi:transcriptional regulator with XRE-family HTH domain